MSEGKSKATGKVGEQLEVKEGAEVIRPDGSRQTLTGSLYVLDVPGLHTVDGNEVNVK